MAGDTLPVLISLSNCSIFSFITHFFCFECLVWRAFAPVKHSSYRPCFYENMRRLRVLELDPLVSDCFLGSSRFGKNIRI